MISIIFPCYNEIENIQKYNKEIKQFVITNKNFEIIFVDNGSNDNLYDYITREFVNFSNISCIKILKNKGYGDGIFQGIKKSKYNVVAWMHADFQVNLEDLKKGCNIYLKNRSKFKDKIFVKACRKNRNYSDVFFTLCMSIISSILFLNFVNDSNATPNIIDKKLFNFSNKIPSDFSFDLFCHLLSIKYKYKILRYNVDYKERQYGFSKWNFNIRSKFYLSLKILLFIIKIRIWGIK